MLIKKNITLPVDLMRKVVDLMEEAAAREMMNENIDGALNFEGDSEDLSLELYQADLISDKKPSFVRDDIEVYEDPEDEGVIGYDTASQSVVWSELPIDAPKSRIINDLAQMLSGV